MHSVNNRWVRFFLRFLQRFCGSPATGLLPRLQAFGIVPQTIPLMERMMIHQGGMMAYRYLTHSVGGFIQQVAVCYVQRGYWFYVAGHIPPQKDPLKIDYRLLDKYEIDLSKFQRCRRKKEGIAGIQYIRYGDTFLLLATKGVHPFFLKEHPVRDARRVPIQLFGYAISSKNGRALVSLDQETYRDWEAYFLHLALHRKADSLVREFRKIPFEPYRPVYQQVLSIWKTVNLKRKTAGFDLVPYSALRTKRRIYRPFESEKGGDKSPIVQAGEREQEGEQRT